MLRRLLSLLLPLAVVFALASPGLAAELRLFDVRLEPCGVEDPGAQPDFQRPMGASCFVLTGEVDNPGRLPSVDTDVYARILDASDEPVLPNRTRVGSIGDVLPGRSHFALRMSVPAGTPGPFQVKNPRARGFSAPVRTRAAVDDDDLLPLEQGINLD